MSKLGKFFKVQNGRVILTDDRPQWLQDAVYEAHQGELPNDWRYQICGQIADAWDAGDLFDEGSRWALANDLVMVSTLDRVGWLASDLARVRLVDDVLHDCETLTNALVIAQIHAIDEMIEIMVQAVALAIEEEGS